jgi:glycosyltransferase involved in cell wall biosynthesis
VSGRVLVVTYFFPPLGGIAVQRSLKFVTYLPRWGWQPVVIAPANPGYTFVDGSLEEALPLEVEIRRTASLEPGQLPNAVARRLSRARAGSGAGRDLSRGPAGVGLPGKVLWKGMIAWNRAWGAVLFPDTAVGWVRFAARGGLQVHRQSPVDAIYSSSGPISSHLAAERIARKTGLPWVADFRDPWIDNAFVGSRRGLFGVMQRRMERRIVAHANRLVFTTQGVLDGYAARYPWAADRMVVIANGYDRADFPAPGSVKREVADGQFHLIYGGSIYGASELRIFLEGLELLVQHRPETRDRLRVEFIGRLNAFNRGVAAAYSTHESIAPVVKYTGYLAHSEAMRRQAAADALLQIVGDDRGKSQIQGGKLMEYLGQDKQILAVVPEGVARDVLRELRWGIVADPTPEGVADGLERLLAAPPVRGRADPEGRYDRVNLTRRLAEVLDEVVAERSDRQGQERRGR